MAPINYSRYTSLLATSISTSSVTIESAISSNSPSTPPPRPPQQQQKSQNVPNHNSHIVQVRVGNRIQKPYIRQISPDNSVPTPAPKAIIKQRQISNTITNRPIQTSPSIIPIITTRTDNPFAANFDEGSSSSTKSSSSKTKSTSKDDDDDDDNDEDADDDEGDSTKTSFTKTTTIHPSSSTTTTSLVSTSSSSTTSNLGNTSAEKTDEGSVLDKGVATTNLSWWQLLSIIICGILFLSVCSWFLFKNRQKKKYKKKQLKKQELEDELKRKQDYQNNQDLLDLAKLKHNRRRGKYDSEDDSDTDSDSEDDDESVYPSRKNRRYRSNRRDKSRKNRRGRDRKNDDSFSDEDELTDSTYYERRKDRNRRRRRRKHRKNRKEGWLSSGLKSAFSFRPSASSSRSVSSDTTKLTPRTGNQISPKSILSNGNSKNQKNSRHFRDSVFSTYNSMKKAAIKLKYHEAKIKLDEQLKKEELIELERKEKIKKANQEIDQFNQSQSQQKEENRAGIGAGAHNNQNSTSSPPKSNDTSEQPNQGWARNGTNGRGGGLSHENTNEQRGGKLLIPPVPRQPVKSKSIQDISTAALLPYNKDPAPPKAARTKFDRNDSLDGEISNLLGNNTNINEYQSEPSSEEQPTSKSDRRRGGILNDISKPEPSYQPSASNSHISLQTEPQQKNRYYPENSIPPTESELVGKQPKAEYKNLFQMNWVPSGVMQSSPTDISGSKSDIGNLPITHPNDKPVSKVVLPSRFFKNNNGFDDVGKRNNTATAGSVSLRGKGSVGYDTSEALAHTDVPPQFGSDAGGNAHAGNKWANRLRERR
ncbi:uncharacterized protein L201_006499 [Kwoniella dendrophila CBS 6074]|uniref:Uncharacterized protein n=1 Tax=Kwoniella dendrophila CBS 6074 TaxID=1295534 RepID=A0AAX4K2Z9_9TREE